VQEIRQFLQRFFHTHYNPLHLLYRTGSFDTFEMKKADGRNSARYG
jgi:hypothetical protein